jgi:hypothetical protein
MGFLQKSATFQEIFSTKGGLTRRGTEFLMGLLENLRKLSLVTPGISIFTIFSTTDMSDFFPNPINFMGFCKNLQRFKKFSDVGLHDLEQNFMGLLENLRKPSLAGNTWVSLDPSKEFIQF